MQNELVSEEVLQQMLKDMGPEILPMLIDNYLAESNHRITAIYKAMDEKDFDTLEFESHTLGSTALALGNISLGQIARKIEGLCLDNRPQDALLLKQELSDIAQPSLTAIKQRLAQGFDTVNNP